MSTKSKVVVGTCSWADGKLSISRPDFPCEIPPSLVAPGESILQVTYEMLLPYLGKVVLVDFEAGTIEPFVAGE